MDEDDCMVAMAKFYRDFTVEESCGKCTPCRVGNKRLNEILQKITNGNGTEEDLTRLRNLALVIKDTALCGLGQTSPNPVLSTMDNSVPQLDPILHQSREGSRLDALRTYLAGGCHQGRPQAAARHRHASLHPLRYLLGEV